MGLGLRGSAGGDGGRTLDIRPCYQMRYACRVAVDVYNQGMPKRTSPFDAGKISVAADLEDLVQDKREGWRASGAKARRRQRRYKALLTQQLMNVGTSADDDEPVDGDD